VPESIGLIRLLGNPEELEIEIGILNRIRVGGMGKGRSAMVEVEWGVRNPVNVDGASRFLPEIDYRLGAN